MLLTKTERMTGGIGVDYPCAARLLDRAAEHGCTKFDSSETGGAEVGNSQVEMYLLRRTIGPDRWVVWRCKLECQLERQTSGVDLTPFGIADIGLPIQKIRVKVRKGWRVGAVEHDGAQADRC